MYLLYHGIKRLLPDLACLEDELWEHHSGLIDPTIDPERSYAHTKGYTPMLNYTTMMIERVADEVCLHINMLPNDPPFFVSTLYSVPSNLYPLTSPNYPMVFRYLSPILP